MPLAEILAFEVDGKAECWTPLKGHQQLVKPGNEEDLVYKVFDGVSYDYDVVFSCFFMNFLGTRV